MSHSLPCIICILLNFSDSFNSIFKSKLFSRLLSAQCGRCAIVEGEYPADERWTISVNVKQNFVRLLHTLLVNSCVHFSFIVVAFLSVSSYV